jgi:hypothetical protein
VVGPEECCAFLQLASCCLSEISMLVTLRFNDRPGVDKMGLGGGRGWLVSYLVGWGCEDWGLFSRLVTGDQVSKASVACGTEEGIRVLPGLAFAIDGAPEATAWAGRIVALLDGQALHVPSESRRLSHASGGDGQ